jgi:hypothetical protein
MSYESRERERKRRESPEYWERLNQAVRKRDQPRAIDIGCWQMGFSQATVEKMLMAHGWKPNPKPQPEQEPTSWVRRCLRVRTLFINLFKPRTV